MSRAEKLTKFLVNLRSDVYLPTFDHIQWVTDQNQLTALRLFELVTKINWKDLKVLEVGFGEGFMLEQFRDAGAVPTGIGLDRDNYKSCDDKGFDVSIMDQSFMDFPDGTFDVLWSQHVLEHSIFPFFTLHEYKRVVRSGGLIYIEVPAPDTSFNHQDDPNHYSVFGKSAWLSLMARTGLRIVDHAELNSLKDSWQDNKYFSFILRKEEK